MRRLLLLSTALFLALPTVALAAESGSETDFDPAHEWELKTWGPSLELGPIDMWSSIRDHFASISDGYDPAVESVLASYRREGMTAGQWGLEGDPEREVDMRRYYTNTCTVYVNPETCQVINGNENIYQFFAEDQDEAEAFSSSMPAASG